MGLSAEGFVESELGLIILGVFCIEIHIANAMVENMNERVMGIVYTHCLRVYSRPVAPLRATLFDFRSDNA